MLGSPNERGPLQHNFSSAFATTPSTRTRKVFLPVAVPTILDRSSMTFLRHRLEKSGRETVPDNLREGARAFGERPGREKRNREQG